MSHDRHDVLHPSVHYTLKRSRDLHTLLTSPLPLDPRMSKLQAMAARARSLPQKLDEMADAAMKRMDDLEQRGGAAFSTLGRELQKADDGVRAVEDVVSQMTNGGPPLDDSAHG